MDKLSLNQLLGLAHEYFPQGIGQYEENYELTKQNKELREAIKSGLKKYDQWKELLNIFETIGFQVEDQTFVPSLERCLQSKFYFLGDYKSYNIL